MRFRLLSLAALLPAVLLVLPALLLVQSTFAQRTLLYCGKLIDPKSGQVSTEMSIVLTGNNITALQKGYLAPTPADKITDLKTRTALPGLIAAPAPPEHAAT